jgi:hypothetical protein
MTNLSQDNTYPGPDLNQAPPEYKSAALLFEPTCLVTDKVDSNSTHATTDVQKRDTLHRSGMTTFFPFWC